MERTVYYGIGVTGKKAIGKLRFYDADARKKARTSQYKGSKEEEKKRLKSAILKTVEKTKKTSTLARKNLGEGEAQIFEIHAMFLEDEDFLEAAILEIENGSDAEEAVLRSSERFAEQLKSIGDEYLSARAADIKDICNGIIDTLRGENEIKNNFESQIKYWEQEYKEDVLTVEFSEKQKIVIKNLCTFFDIDKNNIKFTKESGKTV